MFKVIDLFSGVGGLTYGFKLAGFDIMLANEIDSDIAYAYTRNHPSTKMINYDITKLDIEVVFNEYKDKIDVIVGGPPCQGFSQKGSRKSIKDERNFLFKYYYSVVKYVKPQYFLMENVPNLLTSENGYFRKEIEQLFSEIGYTLDFQILNAADFGVPQTRRRAFILGKYGSERLSLPVGNGIVTTIDDAISDLAYLRSGEGQDVQEYINSPRSDYQVRMREGSNKLYNHQVTNHSQMALQKLEMIPVGKGKEVLPSNLLTKSIYSGTWSRMIGSEQSVTITTRFDTPSSGRFTHPILDRCITVREAARIQSFPDKFRFYGPKSSQMKQVGNAVPPIVGEAIADILHKDIKKRK
ncbi:DNA cytosine methyltransferase [Paenibacillus polymyxa]|uniref:DNA cytosine methyltransferase n=1 Tax=Paenibacillus polymyxa TaxID=1406 RepID=UPI00298C668D|nr:DNA cytosine methyltransferase [Paenibacillus polymyxa]